MCGNDPTLDLRMDVVPPPSIALTAKEQKLRAQIDFEPRDPGFHETLVRSCDAAKPLALSLLKRKAIPETRWAYFTDPEYNVGSKRSRLAIFEGNGCHGEDILGHGTFLKYLKYFIHGPDLPESTIRAFSDLLNRDRDRQELRAYARAEVRTRGLTQGKRPRSSTSSRWSVNLMKGTREALGMPRDQLGRWGMSIELG